MTTELLDNRYKILQALGEGAMGMVYLVEDGTTGQALAMKVLSRQMEANEKSFLQLKQEFRVMAQLRHPNCCAVYDYGQLPDGAPFLTMEVVPGHGLDELLPLGAEQLRQVLAQLLLALGYVHQLGYVHCDIKSANVRVKPDGTVKLMDYGLMEVAGRSGAPIRGTLAYLAPEIVKRGPVDRRADLYSLGCLAYELLAGRPPFIADKVMEVLRAHVADAPPPLGSLVPGLDPALEAIVMRLLAKDPINRYQSAYEALEDLGVEVPAGIGGNLLTSPMVGRDEAMETLAAHLPALAAGKGGGAYLVYGEGGIGKSRLLEELRFRTQLEDLIFVSGVAPDRAAVPYGPFVEALRKLMPTARAQAGETVARLAPVLVKLLPELAVPPAPDLDPPSREKLRLQDAIAALFREVASACGLVLVLEDWHRADALSSELLDFALRNITDVPLLTIVSSRQVPEPAPAWLAQAQRLELGPLDPRGLWRMVTAMLGAEDVGPSFMRQVSDSAGGNPFMVERLLEHLVREGVLVATKGKWNTQLNLTAEHLPQDLGALLLRKLDLLPEAARELARTAAVMGDSFKLDGLKLVAGWRDDELFDALQALEMAQILVLDEGGAYRFAQAQLQRQVYDMLAPDLRAQIHGAMVVALEERFHGVRPAEIAIEDVNALATHSLRAGAGEKAILYALEAGSRSAALFALADAEHFLTEGLALLRLEPGTRWRRQLLSYLQALGDVRRGAGRAKDAKEVLAEAIDLAEELGLQRELGRLLGSQAKACTVTAEYPVALEYGTRAVAISEAAGDDFNVSRALLVVGRVNFFLGNLPEALALASRAVEMAEVSGDLTIMGSAFALAGYFLVASSDPKKIPQGIENLDRSLALLQETGDKLGLINSYNLLGNAQNQLGDHLDAWKSFTKTRTLSYEAGSRSDEVVAVINLAITALDLGNQREAYVRALEAEELSSKYVIRFTHGYAMALAALASVLLGEGGDADKRFELALTITRDIKNKYIECLILQYQVEAMLELGRLDQAASAGKALRALIDETGNAEPETRLNCLMAEVHVRRGELEDASWRADLAWQASTTSLAKGMQVRALRAKAMVAAAVGDYGEARDCAEEALAIGEAIGTKYQNALLLGLLGELALATGTPGALDHFRAMEVLAGQTDVRLIGALARFGRAAAAPYAPEAGSLADEARVLLATLADGLAEADRAAYLSPRERARLMAGAVIAYSLPVRLADRGAALRLWLRVFRAEVA